MKRLTARAPVEPMRSMAQPEAAAGNQRNEDHQRWNAQWHGPAAEQRVPHPGHFLATPTAAACRRSWRRLPVCCPSAPSDGQHELLRAGWLKAGSIDRHTTE